MKFKCKFYKICNLFDKESIACNKQGGMYGDRMATCYKFKEKEMNKKKK